MHPCTYFQILDIIKVLIAYKLQLQEQVSALQGGMVLPLNLMLSFLTQCMRVGYAVIFNTVYES